MNVAVAPIGILVLLIVPALLVGTIVLLIKGGTAVRCFFGILLLLIVIGFFGLFSIRTSRTVAVDQLSQTNAQLQGGAVFVDKNPTLWAEGLEEELTPDVYSSLETAAYGLGVQLKQTLDGLPQLPRRVTILEGSVDDMALLEHFRRGLKYILPDIDIVIASETPEGQVCISLQIKDVESRQITPSEIQNADVIHMSQSLHTGSRGILQAVVQTSDNKFVKQVEFDHCLWLYDTDKFQSAAIGHRWAVITTDETATTKEQARQELYNNATKYVYECLAAVEPLRQNLLQSDLMTYGLVVDEYDQRLVGLSGPIWRSGLLLDVSPERIQSLRQIKAATQLQVRRTWLYQIMSLAGMLALISVLYLLVNAITKGYYSTIIFIVSVIAFLVFVLLFMA